MNIQTQLMGTTQQSNFKITLDSISSRYEKKQELLKFIVQSVMVMSGDGKGKLLRMKIFRSS